MRLRCDALRIGVAGVGAGHFARGCPGPRHAIRVVVAIVAIVLTSLLAAAAAGQTTVPSSAPKELDIVAATAFASGDYATALPMLTKLRDDPAIDAVRRDRIDEMIRLARRNLENPATAVPGQTLLAGTRRTPQASGVAGPTTAPASRTPHVRPADGQVLTLAIKDLGNFDYDPDEGGNIPPDVEALSGATVRLTGYMLPLDQADRVTRFALVTDLMSCCFGQPPQVHHILFVTCPPGKSLTYYPDPIVVTGKLTVAEKKDDGFIVSLFEVLASSVKPAAR